MPPSHLRLSTFRIDALPQLEKKQLGQKEYGDVLNPPQEVLAWAEIVAAKILQPQHGLKIIPGSAIGKECHARHADVIGWPEIPDPEQEEFVKSERKKIAVYLAEQSALVTAD